MIGTIIVAGFTLLMAGGVPIAFVLGGVAILGILASPGGAALLPALPEQVFTAVSSFTFLAIPLFILTGGILAEGGVAKNLMDLMGITIGRGRGGLGASVVMSSLFFHGISGSSSADAAAISKITLPKLKEQGYPVPFSAAMITSACATATLVPPTMDLILIGVVGNISIAGLFAGGIIPAFVNALGLIIYILYVSRKHGYGDTNNIKFNLGVACRAMFRSAPALFMIVIILGGILGGVFTPTEAAGVAVFYGLFLSTVVYRTMSLRTFFGLFRNTIEISGMVLLVISQAALLGYALTVLQVPSGLGQWLDTFAPGWVLFLFLVQLVFFLIGIFMDTVPAILILVPILTPMALARGIEPIHFGILVEVNVALGMATPPIGNCLFAACAVAGIPLERVMKPIWPMIVVLTITMFIITYAEGITMFLPRLLDLVD
jgi:C4-dicarboxylate transporter DctM subunit